MPEALERLVVWQRALMLAGSVRRFTRTLPQAERFDLVTQLNRASASVAANIAEGYGRVGTREYARYLGFSRGSAYEVFTHLKIAQDAGFEVDAGLFEQIEDVLRILNGAMRKLSHDHVSEESVEYGLEDAPD